jgi:hypothetical protein
MYRSNVHCDYLFRAPGGPRGLTNYEGFVAKSFAAEHKALLGFLLLLPLGAFVTHLAQYTCAPLVQATAC